MIKTIIFDLGVTIVDLDYYRQQAEFGKLGIPNLRAAISKNKEISMKPILVIEFFDVWGHGFMSPFLSLNGKYILLILYSVSKLVEAISCQIMRERVLPHSRIISYPNLVH